MVLYAKRISRLCEYKISKIVKLKFSREVSFCLKEYSLVQKKLHRHFLSFFVKRNQPNKILPFMFIHYIFFQWPPITLFQLKILISLFIWNDSLSSSWKGVSYSKSYSSGYFMWISIYTRRLIVQLLNSFQKYF